MEPSVRVKPSVGVKSSRCTDLPLRFALVASALSALMCAPAATAHAFPGQHLWTDVVFTTDVYEDEAAAALTLAPGGCPVVVGSAITAAGAPTDIRHVSYDASSSLWRWKTVPTTWNGSGNGADTAAAVVNSGGADYVAGTTQVGGADTDYVVLKLDDATGTQLWATHYDGTAHGADEGLAIAADGAGNIYVTGASPGADGSVDVATVKLRPDGSTAWVRRFAGASQGADRGLAVAVNGSSVYVAGVSRRAGHGDDMMLIKYSLGGARRWVAYYDDPQHRAESLSAIAATSTAVYACGSGSATAKPGRALLVKFGTGGRVQWAAWAGERRPQGAWSDLAVDGKGYVHLTGTLHRPATAADIATSVYAPNGDMKWRRYLSSTGSHADAGAALTVDAAGRTYVCSSMTNTKGDTDITVVAYSATGTSTLWLSRYPDPTFYPAESNLGNDQASDIVLAGGALYVIGSSTAYHAASNGGAGDTSLDFVTLKIDL